MSGIGKVRHGRGEENETTGVVEGNFESRDELVVIDVAWPS